MLKKLAGVLGVGLGLALLGGCANQEPVAFTHDWTTSQHSAAMTFNDNDRACQAGIHSVSEYEQCMENRGYQLYQP